MSKWKQWIAETRQALNDLPDVKKDESSSQFLADYYSKHLPTKITFNGWPAFNWTLDSIANKVGDKVVQIQHQRTTNKDYEIQSNLHRTKMGFRQFIQSMQETPNNSLYMTAQNREESLEAMEELFKDVGPLPSFLTSDIRSGFFWIGSNTITPLHHDLTNNIMLQVYGAKIVRIISPEEFDKIDYREGVYSNISWLSEKMANDRNIKYTDYLLTPGTGVFIPIGHFHCVKSLGVSITLTYTNFIWSNSFHHNFQGN